MPNRKGSLDPIRLGLIWQRLNGIVDQVSETFIRAAFSTVVRDNYDMAFSLLDIHGRQFVQSRRSIPSFIGTLPRQSPNEARYATTGLHKLTSVYVQQAKRHIVVITHNGGEGCSNEGFGNLIDYPVKALPNQAQAYRVETAFAIRHYKPVSANGRS